MQTQRKRPRGSRRSPRANPVLLAAGFLMLGFAPLSAQSLDVPVLIPEVSGGKLSDRVRPSLVRALSWDAKQRILSAAGLLRVPTRSPAQFSLTPRKPYVVPGGFIRLWGVNMDAVGAPWWSPEWPNPTGSAEFSRSRRVLVQLSRLKPNTRYVLDLSIDTVLGPARSLDLLTCDDSGTRLRTVRVDGAQHVFIAAVTDGQGEACYGLAEAGNGSIYLMRVDVSEIGPSPLSP